MLQPIKNYLLLKVGTTIIVFIILLVPLNANSQFLNPDAKWIVHTFGCPEGCYESYSDIQILKDSIIDNINYSVFEYSHLLLALREDSSKVFFKVLKDYFPDPYTDTSEHILYDFNLNLGDSILLELPRDYYYTKQYWTVFAMDSVLVGNKYKKRLLINSKTDYIIFQYWIEDIGSSFGPLYIDRSLSTEYSTFLHCYQVNGVSLYGDCSHVGLTNFQTNDEISLQFDPFNKQVKIEMPTSECFTLNIYSLLGIKVFSKTIPGNEYYNLPNLRKGLFLFEIQTGSQRHCEKIYIQ